MDAGNINQILSSLSNDDIASLQAMAASLFGQKSDDSSEKTDNQNHREESRRPTAQDNSPGGIDIDPKTLAAIASIMGKLNQSRDDDRSHFIAALRPLLSEKRRYRADEALKIMQLFEILPLLKDSGLF